MKRNGSQIGSLKSLSGCHFWPISKFNEHCRLVCMLYRVPLSDVVQSSVVQKGTQTGGTCLELTVISFLI